MTSESERKIYRQIQSVAAWRQTIEVAPGVFTPGRVDTRHKLNNLALPADFSGKRVLEIGAAEGFFSFVVEQRGGTKW